MLVGRLAANKPGIESSLRFNLDGLSLIVVLTMTYHYQYSSGKPRGVSSNPGKN
jgi:hypothetical protein